MTSLFENLVERFFKLSALLSIGIIFLIFLFMLIMGLPLIKEGLFYFLTEDWDPFRGLYGIGPMIVGTLAISLVALIFALPLSLGCSAFITVVKFHKIANLLTKTVQVSAGIPPVIYGFIAIFTLVPFFRDFFEVGSGMSILSASLVLAILISPTMILIFVDAFRSVRSSYLLAIDSMGCSPVQKFLYVILPCSKNGILGGVFLGMGRAIGDTLIALMIAGNAAQIPSSLFDSARTLTAHIALVKAADVDSIQFKSIFLSGLVLYTFTTIIVSIVHLKFKRKIINRDAVYE